MNKEQQELLDEVYENYWNSHPDAEKTFQYEGHNIETRRMTKDEFVDMVKTDEEYGRRWGLKIEERELTYSERYKIWFSNNFETGMEYCEDDKPDFDNEYYEPTPIKLTTITYNNETIKSYE